MTPVTGGTVKCGRRDTADNAGDPHQQLAAVVKRKNAWTASSDGRRQQIALGVVTAASHERRTDAHTEAADE
jgi:hypothetical protein